MPSTTAATQLDPLSRYPAGARVQGSERPLPLRETHFDIHIAAGVAVVTTSRTFHNAEAQSIEATITFPVPVHAALFALEAGIDGRVLHARAQRRKEARETYEGAIDSGKTAVLHEEVLRGVHMLSVGHVPPGAEVTVIASWADILSQIGGASRLRIPLTVGEIYGRSPLPDSDDLIYGGPLQHASLEVTCEDGQVSLAGAHLYAGRATVPLNRPIDLVVTDWQPRALRARAADGRTVTITVAPTPQEGSLWTASEPRIETALLVDHSGSMNAPIDPASPLTAHAAVTRGLAAAANKLAAQDYVHLWEFDDRVRSVGPARGPHEFGQRLRALSQPRGGTEIGAALESAIGQTECRDIVLVTDGKSYALDVQKHARSGRRVNVVLVGEDSLEANVGHLAALTGGTILVADASNIDDALCAALLACRMPHERRADLSSPLQWVRAFRGNMTVGAQWSEGDIPSTRGTLSRAVSALAASQALASMDEGSAAQLAEAEGLVCHLTSLVLVDEAGERQEGLPATRKVALPTPAASDPASATFLAVDQSLFAACQIAPSPDQAHRSYALADQPSTVDLSWVASLIDWASEGERLRKGDLSTLDARAAREISTAAALPSVEEAGRALGLTPVVLVVALIAASVQHLDRHAARVARAIPIRGEQTAITVAESLGLNLHQYS